MKSRSFASVMAVVFSLAGTASCVSLVLSFLPGEPGGFWLAAASPGKFLFRSFHAAAFFLPLYFWACSYFLVRAPFRFDRLVLLNYLILPFFTLSVSLRLFTDFRISASPATAFFARSFSGTGGAVLTALLVLLELTVIPQLAARLRRKFLRQQQAKTLLLEAPSGSAQRENATRTETPADNSGAAHKSRAFLPLLEEGSLLANRQPPEEESFPAEENLPETESAALVLETAVPSGEEPEEEEKLSVKFTRGKMIELAPLTGILTDDEIPLADMDDAEGLSRQDGEEAAYADEENLSGQDDAVYADAGDYSENGEELSPGSTLQEDDSAEDSGADSFTELEDGIETDTDEDAFSETAAAEKPDSAGEDKTSAKPKKRRGKYFVPVEGILAEYAGVKYWEIDEETRQAGELLRATLEEFKIQAEVMGIRKGPVITMFEILPEPGVKLSKIVNLADNIALRLAASPVRIVAPIPGKHAVGIEIPNKHRAIVSFAELINAEKFSTKKMEIPLAIGKDITGEAQIIDLVETPHLLIAGTTGSGKSVCVNSIICSVLYNRTPEEVKLILIDPKIVELKFYNDVPHLLTPVITEPKKAFQALQYAISEMEQRYALLNKVGARDIRSFNQRIKREKLATTPLPYIVIIIDEFADLLATTGKELESTLARLAAMSRAIGIHLILATQRPSIEVITGLIKANIPSRIAFKVAGNFNSRIIIDAVGAEKLLGQGDMLFVSVKNPVPVRLQGAYLAEEEVERIVAHVKTLGEPDYIDDEIFIEEDDEAEYFEEDGEDPFLDEAIEIVTAAGKASASYLQRRLKIGYNRAARMVETMERRGIVGPQDGSKARRVLGGE